MRVAGKQVQAKERLRNFFGQRVGYVEVEYQMRASGTPAGWWDCNLSILAHFFDSANIVNS
jgi:hypothetical protein